MKRYAFAPLLLALALPGLAGAADYTVQPGSELGFTGTFQGESFKGTFGKWTAAISYDAAKLATSKFDVEASLTTTTSMRTCSPANSVSMSDSRRESAGQSL